VCCSVLHKCKICVGVHVGVRVRVCVGVCVCVYVGHFGVCGWGGGKRDAVVLRRLSAPFDLLMSWVIVC